MFKKNLLVIIIVLAAAAGIAGNAYAAVPASEREALIALYNSTGGENWYVKDSWLGEAGTECTWFGVTCGAEGNHVTEIGLYENNLSGEVPAEIGKLSNLEGLLLYNNQLTALPAEIGNLTNLQHLDLYHNQLAVLLAEIGNLTNLNQLYLSSNHLTAVPADSPVIWKITSSGDRQGAYKIGDTVSVSVTFSSPVSLEHGNLILTLETGETDRTVTISPSDLSDTVIGTYTVQEGDMSDDLNVSSIRLSGGTLKDAEGSAVWTTDPGYAILALQILAGMNPANISLGSVDFSGDGKIGIEDVLCILRSVVRQDYREYTDTAYANLADMKNIVIDGAKPVLAVTRPETDSCVKTLDKIKGTVSDESGEYTVALKITEGTETVYDKEWLTAKGEQNWEFDTSEITWTKNAAYTVTATATDYAGNTDTKTVSFSYDKKSSSVTCELSAEQIIFGEHLTVSGRITPAENVTDRGVSIRLVSPRGSISRSTKANEDGYFKYDLQCDDFNELDSAGQWTVSAAWEGNMCLNEAESEPITLTTSKGASQVTLDLTSGAIKSDEKISVSGKFTPQPFCGGNIPRVSIMLLISGPYGNKTEIVTTDDNAGHFRLKDYTGLTALGDWTVQAVFNPTDAYRQSISDLMSVRVVESAGYAIIVQGKIGTGEGIESHKKTTDFVYKQMKDRGIQDDKSGDESVQDIRYFHYSDKESIPSKQAVKDAVTTWARDKMNTSPANLYIVMVDHGLENKFFIDQDNPQLNEQDKTITSAELGEWLDTLQIGLNAQAMNQKIVAILGFCHSGSFIENLSGFNRVIIASAATDESSYKGPLDQDNIREGEFFISEFFKKAAFGKTIRTCFEEAVALTEQFTSGTGGSTNAPPYYDTSLQHPLLDDNGDKTGSNNLSVSGADGELSSRLIIGVSSLTGNDPGDVSLTGVADTIFISEQGEFPETSPWAKVDSKDRFRTMWIEIKSPKYRINESSQGGQSELDLPRILYDRYDGTEDRYVWDWQNIQEHEKFSEPGIYQVFYFAKDDVSGNVSPFKETRVYRNKSGNSPPGSFALESPEPGITLTVSGMKKDCDPASDQDCYVTASWEEPADPDGDSLTYNIWFSKNDPEFGDSADLFREENLENSVSVFDLPAEWDGSTVYWKVQAVDGYGAVRESDTRSFEIDNYSNPATGGIKGYVYESDTEPPEPLSRAKVRIVTGNRSVSATTTSRGFYFEKMSLGEYEVHASKTGYKDSYPVEADIREGETVSQNFFLEKEDK